MEVDKPDVAVADTRVAVREAAVPDVAVPDVAVPDVGAPEMAEQDVVDVPEAADEDTAELANAKVLWHLAKAANTHANLEWKDIEAWVDGERGLVNGGPNGVKVVSGPQLRKRPHAIDSDNLIVIGFSHGTLAPEDMADSCKPTVCEWGDGHFASAVFAFGRRADGQVVLRGTWEAPAQKDGDDLERRAKAYKAWEARLEKVFGATKPD